jgi:hypothetical protein
MMAFLSSSRSSSRGLTYAGIFLIAQATLMLEILLTRIISVMAWYHLAFFVISVAMLGMTAGAVLVFVVPTFFGDSVIPERLAQSALGFAIATPCSAAIALSMPLAPVDDFMSFIGLLGIGCVLAAPFVLGGITLTLALTRAGLPPNVAYGVDLVGAASGCALVIPMLAWFDAPSATVVTSSLAALASAAFAKADARSMRTALVSAGILAGLSVGNASAGLPPLRPAWGKGGLHGDTHSYPREDPADFMYTRWNTYSRVTVDREVNLPPGAWARSSKTPAEMLEPRRQRVIKIDGAAATIMAHLGGSPLDHRYLDWDLPAAVHALRPHGAAAVIGVGGGEDVLEALRVGHKPVVGIELNDLIVQLHRKRMASFSGLASLADVELVSDEARSYLARDRRHYSTITMSLIDTWASTGSGAYSLSENGLYTVEAWRTFVDRLEPRGILAVTRWYFADSPGETARMLSLAMETAWETGARDPRLQIVILQNENVATLLLSRRPFSAADLDRVEQVASEKGYAVTCSPRALPFHRMLFPIIRQPTPAALQRWTSTRELDLTPPTDARPFFFNMLKPANWLKNVASANQLDQSFLGNLQASHTLLYATLVSFVLSCMTLLWPLLGRSRELRAFSLGQVASALAYFALIGLGFMFVEMGLLSPLNVFLGHPTLALSVLLGGMIFFAGIGSLWSGRVDLSRPLWLRLYPWIPAALVLAVSLGLLPAMHAFGALPTGLRVAVALALVAPPAVGLGLCFPLGLRLAERMEQAAAGRGPTTPPRLGPWLWGVNGAFGVCASGLALSTSMIWGIPTTLMIGACCYLILPLLTRQITR